LSPGIRVTPITRLVHNGGMRTPLPFIAPEVFNDPDAALARVQAIYAQSVTHLRQAMQRFVAGEEMQDRVRAPICLRITCGRSLPC
jgi:Bacterial AMP nucleoside phosphorylase N-terminus